MAHKHNRRRTRPRKSPLNPTLDISDDSSSSSDSTTPFESSTSSLSSTSGPKHPQLPATHRPVKVSVATKHWQNRYLAWQNRDKAQKREAANIEAEQIKLFGGEPGDDVGLCYKMMEVFEGMDWIETLE